MSEQNIIQLVKQFYVAFADGDRDFIESHITDDFSFSAPPDPLLDRNGYFERCWPGAGTGQKFNIIRTIVDGGEVVVTYEMPHEDGTKGLNTEIFTIQDDRIKRVEVYFGWSE